MSESTNEPLAQAWLRRLKNHPVVATLVVATAVVTGAAALAQSLATLKEFFRAAPTPSSETAATATASDASGPARSAEDRQLERALLGTWQASVMPPAPPGTQVVDFRYTYLPNGIVNTRGSYRYGFQIYPIILSGSWKVTDRILEYSVDSSNIPQAVSVGFRSQLRILAVDDETFAYVDLLDGTRRIDTRAR